MATTEINALEHAGRFAMVWSPENSDRRVHFGAMMAAMVPAFGILAVAAVVLLALF